MHSGSIPWSAIGFLTVPAAPMPVPTTVHEDAHDRDENGRLEEGDFTEMDWTPR